MDLWNYKPITTQETSISKSEYVSHFFYLTFSILLLMQGFEIIIILPTPDFPGFPIARIKPGSPHSFQSSGHLSLSPSVAPSPLLPCPCCWVSPQHTFHFWHPSLLDNPFSVWHKWLFFKKGFLDASVLF